MAEVACSDLSRQRTQIQSFDFHQISALALVGTRKADIVHEPEICVIDPAQDGGRNLQHDWTVLHVDAEEIVDVGGIRVRKSEHASIRFSVTPIA